MLEKFTFDSDADANKFFRENPYVFLVKFVVNGNKQHYIITRNRNLGERVHLKTEFTTQNGGGVRNG
jgi:hypothetical protein